MVECPRGTGGLGHAAVHPQPAPTPGTPGAGQGPWQPLELLPALLAPPWKATSRGGAGHGGGHSPALGPASLRPAPAAWQRVRVVAGGAALGRKGSFTLNPFALGPARGHGLLGVLG